VKQRIVFVAVTAPASMHELGLDRAGVEIDGTAKKGIQALEGNCGGM
jgi:hypothetical protein